MSAAPTFPPLWWLPYPGTPLQVQLDGAPLNVTVDADVFVVPWATMSGGVATVVRSLGRRVVCHFSAGAVSDDDADWIALRANMSVAQLNDLVGNRVDSGRPGSPRWLNIASDAAVSLAHRVLLPRMQQAKSRGCDALLLDHVDVWDRSFTGVAANASTQLRFNARLASEAHSAGLGVGLMNDARQLRDLVTAFDFVVVEECVPRLNCVLATPFVAVRDAAVAAATVTPSMLFLCIDLACAVVCCGRAGRQECIRRRVRRAWTGLRHRQGVSCDRPARHLSAEEVAGAHSSAVRRLSWLR
jgi:hypothetical protein